MRSTADKFETLRTATAQAVLKVGARHAVPLHEMLRSGPKGDALEIARAAGIMAAKRTWELIPYCHPVPIDQIVIDYTFSDDAVTIMARATAVAKTGVEMEALVAAQIAATTIFDMLKPLGIEMTITDIKVLEKMGGKSSFSPCLSQEIKAAIIVTSDGVAAGKREDQSGALIKERLEHYGATKSELIILPDDREKIQATLIGCIERKCDLVITTGGTGLGPRDVTVEATRAVIEREVPGVMEAARAHGQRRTPYAMLSRGLAGVTGKTVIVNLPGSATGVKESLDALFPALLHSVHIIAGGGHA